MVVDIAMHIFAPPSPPGRLVRSYADNHVKREEARRIAKAISRLPELLRRPTY